MPDKNQLIVNHLSQARANSPTYGKTGDDFKITCKTFSLDLEKFEPDVIDSSFNEWRRENREFPHTSDIIKICTRIQKQRYSCANQGEQDALQIEHRKSGEKSEDDKNQVTAILKDLYKQRDILKAEKRGKIGEPNYTHWERQTPEQKAEVMDGVKKAWVKLKSNETNH